jgi:hypothetical protein
MKLIGHDEIPEPDNVAPAFGQKSFTFNVSNECLGAKGVGIIERAAPRIKLVFSIG